MNVNDIPPLRDLQRSKVAAVVLGQPSLHSG
jgi:hypothetical protein